jgi:putative PIN family toxin of toxin-antitoxin system
MGTRDIVIDTNILVSAQRSRRGASSKLLSLLGEDYFTSHVSVPLVLEYEAVLVRERHALNITAEEVSAMVDAMCRLSQWHKIYYLWRPVLPDEKDEMILELAVKAGSASIITYNARDFKEAARFGIDIMTPKAFLEKIGVIKP